MNTEYGITVIIPTFNEENNIASIIHAVNSSFSKSGISGEILVVDDESRDETIEIVRNISRKCGNVRIIVRHEDHGLSQSVVEGFKQANSELFLVIDADFSHPPELIPRFYEEIKKGHEVVVGSRYIRGGGIRQWPLKRRVLSLGATGLGRILFPEVTDPVSGFFAVKKEVVERAPLKPRGYKILMEILGKGRWDSISEVPFTFSDRKGGESKLSLKIILEYIEQVLNITKYSIDVRDNSVWNEWKRLSRFCFVGLSGIAVNMGALYLLTEYSGFYFLTASAVAIELSIINNFIWNDIWTFKPPENLSPHRESRFHRFLSFQCVSIASLLINMGILYSLTDFLGVYYMISNFIGILVVFFWNYFVNRNLTWKLQPFDRGCEEISPEDFN
ncbi:glycosyltransferase family 2 protein [Methanosarcina sp. KYL-1]|uniref:glycosyltransferase n=1 Tax=Methanosarcina sp. KYL-1 TaxID=2602068 RepID=UPI002101BD24|nr:glycosyltransferase family 2 protein [Methanosarcina sp. KYL-1]MCQ1536904.1 glycosyltransferase family 2 protein [Methanosarcina sp. KYL-1]